MRRTSRLLAAVKPVAARYLEPGAPTGLTGLHANPSPRATLLYLYASTLAKLKPIPETSVYRQSVEAVTKHRMAAVEAVKPAGFDEWLARATEIIKKNQADLDPTTRAFVIRQSMPQIDERYEEWGGSEPTMEGLPASLDEEKIENFNKTDLSEEEREVFEAKMRKNDMEEKWEDEPQLTIAQIEELENKIGAGLIEEVIQVAEGELALVDTMIQGKVWESLDEKPAPGQWEYFERKA